MKVIVTASKVYAKNRSFRNLIGFICFSLSVALLVTTWYKMAFSACQYASGTDDLYINSATCLHLEEDNYWLKGVRCKSENFLNRVKLAQLTPSDPKFVCDNINIINIGADLTLIFAVVLLITIVSLLILRGLIWFVYTSFLCVAMISRNFLRMITINISHLIIWSFSGWTEAFLSIYYDFIECSRNY